MRNSNMNGLAQALASLKSGKLIIIYDGDDREGEADMVVAAQHVNPKTIHTFRCDAGGLICLAISGSAATRLGLPFMTDVLKQVGGVSADLSCKRTAYGDKPAFSLAINHKDVFTGITDNDRALTITKFDELVRDKNKKATDLVSNFYSPGHIFLLIGRGIENRKGHTELSLELTKRAGLEGGIVMCEMLGRGKALAKTAAKEYSKKHDLVFVEGQEILV